jgi:signal transduction histidine kinase
VRSRDPTLSRALAKNIQLEIVLDPRGGSVRGDPNRLQQVLWNLLTNAVKFTPKGGRISITLAQVDSSVEIEVADNGEGMDAAFLPHVFDRFRQADNSSTRPHGGFGPVDGVRLDVGIPSADRRR